MCLCACVFLSVSVSLFFSVCSCPPVYPCHVLSFRLFDYLCVFCCVSIYVCLSVCDRSVCSILTLCVCLYLQYMCAWFWSLCCFCVYLSLSLYTCMRLSLFLPELASFRPDWLTASMSASLVCLVVFFVCLLLCVLFSVFRFVLLLYVWTCVCLSIQIWLSCFISVSHLSCCWLISTWPSAIYKRPSILLWLCFSGCLFWFSLLMCSSLSFCQFYCLHVCMYPYLPVCEEQNIRTILWSIPATLPGVNWAFHSPDGVVKLTVGLIDALHSYHIVTFDSSRSLWFSVISTNNVFMQCTSAFVSVLINRGDYYDCNVT